MMLKRRHTKPAGRKPLPPALTKRNIVSVGFNDAEISIVAHAAKAMREPISVYCREAVLAWVRVEEQKYRDYLAGNEVARDAP